jgi:Tfp pilus assembly protein PilP
MSSSKHIVSSSKKAVISKACVGLFMLLNLSACAGSSQDTVSNWWYNQRWESTGEVE